MTNITLFASFFYILHHSPDTTHSTIVSSLFWSILNIPSIFVYLFIYIIGCVKEVNGGRKPKNV